MDMAAKIRARGEAAGVTETGTKRGRVTCQGCGRFIFSDGDLSKVEYVQTKRRSEWFFHRGCMEKVWRRKIV